MLADDHTVIREGLHSLLAAFPDMAVVGEAENGRETVHMAKKHMPDIVIMDVSMPDLNGIDATCKITAEAKPPKVIALSMHSDRRFVEQMLKAGASGYLLKNCASRELVFAIREVVNGNIYLSPGIAGIVVNGYLKHMPETEHSAAEALTAREREVVQLISEGCDTKHIGEKLHLSPKTIETHRRRIMEKLHIDSIAGLTKYAIREGLTQLDK